MFSSRTAFFSAAAAPPAPEPMILTIDTTLQANLVMLLPLRGNVNANIDWGDGNTTAVSNPNQTTNISKTYAANGNYTITISGTVAGYGNSEFDPNPTFGTGTNLKITNITTFGNIGLTSIAGAFRGANNLIGITNQIPGTITNMAATFRNSNLNANISNITNWNTSNIANMLGTFLATSAFNQNIGSWNVGNVTMINLMFFNATNFNQNLSSWVTGLTSQPASFSTGANAIFADNASNLKPYLQDGVTRIDT